MWPLTEFRWYRAIDGHSAGRQFHYALFLIGIFLASAAFAVIYARGDDDGGGGRHRPVPPGPLTVPSEWFRVRK